MGWQISYSQCRPFHNMNQMKQRQVSAVSILSTTGTACPAEQSSGRKQYVKQSQALVGTQIEKLFGHPYGKARQLEFQTIAICINDIKHSLFCIQLVYTSTDWQSGSAATLFLFCNGRFGFKMSVNNHRAASLKAIQSVQLIE